MGTGNISILNWDKKVNELKTSNPETYTILNRIYNYYTDKGTIIIPQTFKEKALSYMGDKTLPPDEALQKIETQQILKITNKWTGEGAVFNSLRAQRPGVKVEGRSSELQKLIEETKINCDFCSPKEYTPEDQFGRVKGKHCITATNLAKYDAWSSLLIFKKHNPLDFNLEELSDYLETAFSWFNRVHDYDENYKYPFLIWNCLYKAGASQVHGHAQILMTKKFPYAKIENIYYAAEEYEKTFGEDYFKDLYEIHLAFGLAGFQEDVQYLLSLTPLKEKEILIISLDSPDKSAEAKEILFKILRCYIDVLGVENFNLAVYCPVKNQSHLPYLIKIVDRGPLLSKTVDMGGMELYGSSIASNDPYRIMNSLNKYWEKK